MSLRMMAALFIMVTIAGCDDDFYGASKSIEKSVATSSQPTIIVDACGGAITVKPGRSGEVKALIDRNSNCKNLSQSIAEDALRFIDIKMVVEGDVVHIVTSRTDGGASKCYLTTSIEIYVPDRSRLNLKTEVGSIYVVGSPLEVKALNQGGVMAFVLTPPSDASIAPRRTASLNLEGWGGDVGIKLGKSDYEFTGPIKLVERLTSE
jgi:hypothetical protein